MGEQQEIKDQHFLPQCYLNGFVNEKGKLFSLDLKLFVERGKRPYARESNPAKICKDVHFYTVEEDAKVYNLSKVTDKFLVEKSFHEYENTFQELITKVTSGPTLSVNDASRLIRIIVDLKFRNKYYREKLIGPRQTEVINEAFEEIKATFVNDPEFRTKYLGITPEEMAAINHSVKGMLLNDPKFKKHAHLSSLVNREDGYDTLLTSLVPKLLKCRWVVMRSNGKFISNDNPGCVIDSDNKIHNTYFDHDFLFFMPLTASYCLTISDASEDPFFLAAPTVKQFPMVEASDDMIRMSNNFAIKHFNKIAYGPDKALLDELAQELIITKQP
ncbi:DUF4238 domain-containing protein [Mucilaginibacter lacusdianchii]|uniref:DUF4238 domain-containing protein n=1 Tax=Mucilaginibacter lacusdianchii TaxID=2684211 RepID=UPI00131B8B99|nr:DUF4238 domain-containing protein [Mucilaginibacter sp. JXJ CY 39]